MADEAHTLSQRRATRLSVEEASLSGFTHKYRIDEDDYTFANTGVTDTVTITLGATPTDFLIDRAAINVVTAWAGADYETITMMVGTDGDQDNFIDAQSVTTAGPIIAAAGAIVKTEAGSIAAASDNLVVRLTNGNSGSPSTWAAGQTDVYLGIRGLNDLG